MKKIKILLIICILSLITTGCWNYHELNDLAITTGIAIDVEEDNYVVSYMIANSKKSQIDSSNSEASTVVYTGKGKSISSAYMDLNSKNPKIPYISHLEVVIISEEVARQGVIDILDFLMRNPESRKEFYVVLSKDVDAGSILEILSPLESFPSQNVYNNIISNKNDQSTIVLEQYSDFISKMIKEGINPVLSGVEIEGNEEKGKEEESLKASQPSANIKIDTIGIFKGDKLLGWANHDETVGINILNNEVGAVLLESKCDDEYMASTLKEIETTTNISFEGDIPKLKIEVKGTGALVEINCKRNLEEEKVIKELGVEFEKTLKNMLEEAINLAQKEYKSDIFGYGEMIRRNHLKKWEKIKDNWDDEGFANMKIEIETSISLSSKGSFEQTIMEAIR